MKTPLFKRWGFSIFGIKEIVMSKKILLKTTNSNRRGRKIQIPPTNRIVTIAQDGTFYAFQNEAMQLFGNGFEAVNAADKKKIVTAKEIEAKRDNPNYFNAPKTASEEDEGEYAETYSEGVETRKEEDDNEPIGDDYMYDEEGDVEVEPEGGEVESERATNARQVLESIEDYDKTKVSDLDELGEAMDLGEKFSNLKNKKAKYTYLQNHLKNIVNEG